MSSIVRSLVVAGLAAGAAIAVGTSMPAEAKGKKFKASFALKLPGEPKGAASMKAATKPPIGQGTGFIYNDGAGSLTLNGISIKAGLTTVNTTMTVNVFGGMDLTGVTFPVTRPALITLSYSKTTIKLSDPQNPKIIAYTYSTDQSGATVTVTSYDPATGEIAGTLEGNVQYHENLQDPGDDARDGTVVALTNAKFALNSLN